MNYPLSFLDLMRKETGRAKLRSVFFGFVMALFFIALGGLIPIATQWAVAGFVWATLFLAFGFYLGWCNIKEVQAGNPVDRQLQAIGGPEEVARQLEKDFSGQPFRPNQLYLSPRWICFARRKVAIVRRVDSVIWIYLETVRHRIQGIIPYRTTNQLLLWDRTGRAAAIVLTRKEAETALASLQIIAPWMLIGYSETLKESWNNDREDLIALVDQRRKQAAAGTGPQ